MQVLISEVLKIGILFLLFALLGSLKLFVFSLLILTTTRALVGGFHAKGFLSCLLLTAVFFLSIYVGSIYFTDIIYNNRILILIISQLIFITKAPLASSKKPIYTKERYIRLKFAAMIITLFWAYSLIFIVKDIELSSIGTLTIALQATQLVFRKNHLLFKGDNKDEEI